MRLKYITIGLMFSLLALVIPSCSLDYNPLDQYSDVTEGESDDEGDEILFKDKKAVLEHRDAMYKRLQDRQEHWYLDILLIGESHADNAYAGTTGAEVVPFETNSIEGSNSVLARDWTRYLADIALANKMICGVDEVDDASLTSAERAQYKAEGKILRALVYFDMVRIFGNVPVITKVAGNITSETIADVYPDYFPMQSTEEETYEQIIKDLTEALEHAPANNPSNKTILSKSVAQASLAKAYAEKPLRDYEQVIKYCDMLEADGFKLVDDFSDLFGMNDDSTNPKMRNTAESILEIQYFPGNGNWVSWMLGRDLINWNLNFTWAKWITPSRDLINLYNREGDTKRYEESVVWYETGWSNYYPASNYPFAYKCRSANSSIIKLRFADILLLKAEALIMKDSPDLSGAATIIDRVRERAGIAKLPQNIRGNKESMLKALLDERRMELAFEGQRWFDLCRLNKVEEVMNAVFAKDEGRIPQIYKFNEDSYRLAIPQSAIDANENLVQNPGY